MSKESIFFEPGIKHVELPWKVIQHVGNQRKMVVVVNAFVLFASAEWPRRQRRYPQLPRLKVSSAVISMIAVHSSAEKRSAIAPNEPGPIPGRESLF